MPAARAPRGPCAKSLRRDVDGVTPVVGSILVLAITVLGISGVMVWGAPTVERIQSRNAQAAMQGELEGLRDATMGLSVPDHSRFPTIALPSGTLGLQEGIRIMMTASHDPDPAYDLCDFHVSGWSDADNTLTVTGPGCRAIDATSLQVFSVGGTTMVEKEVSSVSGSTATVTGADFSQGDWMFRLGDGGSPATVYAQAWLHGTDQVFWDLPSGSGRRELFLEGSAVFSRSDGAWFLQKAPPLGDITYGTDHFGFWLRSLVAPTHGSISGSGTHQVYLSLLGNSVRIDEDGVHRLRLDFAGDLAEPWCNAMLARNGELSGASYSADAAFPCAGGDAQGQRSVSYARSDGSTFKFRLLHARIHASLVV